MIEYDKTKYHVRDSLYEEECKRIISGLESAYVSGSYFGLKNTDKRLSSLKMLITKNNEDRDRYYIPNIRQYNKLKDWISWDFIEPLSEFESEVLPILNKAKDLLDRNDYRENNKASEKLETVEALLKEYIKNTGLIDSGIRNQINTRINRLKVISVSGSFFSIMFSDKILNEIKILFDLNSRQYEKFYRRILKKAQVVHSFFEKYAKLIKINDANDIRKQFSEIDEIMKSQSYEKFEDALDILDVIEIKLDEVKSDKKTNILNGIERNLQSLRTKIWLEDWEQIKIAVDQLVVESEDKGVLHKLNLDKFNLDKKISDKKDDIFTFIKNIQSKNYSNQTNLVKMAENMLKNEASRSDLESLTGKKQAEKKRETDQKEGMSPQKKKLIKIASITVIAILCIVIFSVNQVKNAEHFSQKGEKYAVFAEAIVYTLLKSGSEIDKEKVRSRMGASEKDLQIIDLNDKEVVIRFKGSTHRKKVRPVKQKTSENTK